MDTSCYITYLPCGIKETVMKLSYKPYKIHFENVFKNKRKEQTSVIAKTNVTD